MLFLWVRRVTSIPHKTHRWLITAFTSRLDPFQSVAFQKKGCGRFELPACLSLVQHSWPLKKWQTDSWSPTCQTCYHWLFFCTSMLMLLGYKKSTFRLYWCMLFQCGEKSRQTPTLFVCFCETDGSCCHSDTFSWSLLHWSLFNSSSTRRLFLSLQSNRENHAEDIFISTLSHMKTRWSKTCWQELILLSNGYSAIKICVRTCWSERSLMCWKPPRASAGKSFSLAGVADRCRYHLKDFFYTGASALMRHCYRLNMMGLVFFHLISKHSYHKASCWERLEKNNN